MSFSSLFYLLLDCSRLQYLVSTHRFMLKNRRFGCFMSVID
uniref:Uncharacterized protein n=1 Tax=Rhizophora mucronata TaxID=61149 RepID=A0A2P2R156_RHIMU